MQEDKIQKHATTLRVFGFLLSLVLTLTAYYIIVAPETFHLGSGMAVSVIFALALLQALVQILFFLDIWTEKGPLWNLNVFLSTVSIIFIIIWFSVWIMDHLNYNMMLHS